MTTKVKITYRVPSFLEGVSRIFDISGVFRDEVTVVHVPSVARTRKSREPAAPEVGGARAIAAASRRVNEDMSIVAGRMRPVVVRRHKVTSADEATVGSR